MSLWMVTPTGKMVPKTILRSGECESSEKEIEDAVYAINYLIVHKTAITTSGEPLRLSISYEDVMEAFRVDLPPYQTSPEKYYALFGRTTPIELNRAAFVIAMDHYRDTGWDRITLDWGDERNPTIHLDHHNQPDCELFRQKFMHYLYSGS